MSGNWNNKISVTPYENGTINTSLSEVLYQKKPYPEKHEYMYGLTHFALQMNYFPNFLQNVVAPTDTRRRPDQRHLENGDMISAAKEKERLEVKQRTVRKWKEKNKIEHKPVYFEE